MMETLKHNDSGQMPDDAGIVDLYWQRDENAIRLTELKYKNYLLTVAYHIVHDSLDVRNASMTPISGHGTRCRRQDRTACARF